MLSKSEQLEIAESIDRQTFKERWQLLDNLLPDAGFSDGEIIKEVRAVRYTLSDFLKIISLQTQ